MTESKEEGGLPQPTAGDWVHTMAKAGISALPVVGGPAAELLAAIILPPLTRRRDEWFRQLGEKVEELASEFDEFKPENLQNNEAFVAAVLAATQIALRTHQRDKLAMLRNVALNSARPLDVNGSVAHTYLNWLDVFSAHHVLVLCVCENPRAFINQMTEVDPATVSSIWLLAPMVIPDLREDPNYLHIILQDLVGRNLIDQGLMHEPWSIPIMPVKPLITDLGRRFLRFLEEPRGPEADGPEPGNQP